MLLVDALNSHDDFDPKLPLQTQVIASYSGEKKDPKDTAPMEKSYECQEY